MTGLVYYRSRYYDPVIGRFTQRDLIGFAGGINLYAYVGNNPTNYVEVPVGVFLLLKGPDCLRALKFRRDWLGRTYDEDQSKDEKMRIQWAGAELYEFRSGGGVSSGITIQFGLDPSIGMASFARIQAEVAFPVGERRQPDTIPPLLDSVQWPGGA